MPRSVLETCRQASHILEVLEKTVSRAEQNQEELLLSLDLQPDRRGRGSQENLLTKPGGFWKVLSCFQLVAEAETPPEPSRTGAPAGPKHLDWFASASL